MLNISKDSEYYKSALGVLTEARRRLDAIAEKDAEEHRLRTEEEARLRRMAEEEAFRAQAGCPDITGRYEHPELENYMMAIKWNRGSDPISYIFERDDTLFSAYRSPPPYNVLVGRSIRRSWRDINDVYRSDELEVIFHAKCDDGQLVIDQKHNYSTNWLISYPFRYRYAYRPVGNGNMQVSGKVEWDPRDSRENADWTSIWRLLP